MSYPIYAFAVLPYIRAELPGWGRLYKLSGGHGSIGDRSWDLAPKKVVRGKWHGYIMQLELSNWSQRITYFLGRYYELDIQLLLNKVLLPGNRFVDIGANIGMISLHAANLVTEMGSVESFEPNPDCVQNFLGTIELNSISHITVYPIGLSDSPGVMNLNFSSSHSGTATLRDSNHTIKSIHVDIDVGDRILLRNQKPIDVIKIDVEGFEYHVLKGLRTVLITQKPLVILEFIESHFRQAHTSCDEIAGFLDDLGYCCYAISTSRTFLKHSLNLLRIKEKYSQSGITNALWIHNSDTRMNLINSLTHRN